MNVTFEKQSDTVWTITGARLSYPNLWKPGLYEGAPKAGLDSSFLIPKSETALIKEIKLAYLKLGNALDSSVKKLTMLKDCKLKMTDDGDLIIQTNNTLDYPPVYFNLKGKKESNPIAAGAAAELYAGCHTKVKLSLNPTSVYNAKTKKNEVKIWVGISAIQFAADGERLGGGMSEEEVEEGFSAVKGADMGGDDKFEDDTSNDLDADGLDDDLDGGDDLSLDDDDDLEL